MSIVLLASRLAEKIGEEDKKLGELSVAWSFAKGGRCRLIGINVQSTCDKA